MGLRLRLFDRIPYFWAIIFAAALAFLQVLEHTDLLFAVCSFVYILVATTGFNIAGGLTTLPGAFIFANAMLTCIIGITTKALLGEPAQQLLKNGDVTIQIYVLGMLAMTAAALVERRFRARRPFVETVLPIRDLDAAYFGCALVGFAADLYFTFNEVGGPGSLSALFAQLNGFSFFAIILGTIRAVRKSQGRYCLSPLLTFLILFSTARGFASFSKQGMFSAFVCWVIGMFAAQYRLKPIDLPVMALGLFVLIRFGVPLSQFGRNSKPEGTLIASAQVAFFYLQNFDLIDNGYAEGKSDYEVGQWRFFAKDLGQMERLTMLTPDDDLIHYTDQGHVYGFTPVIEQFENQVPHFIWRDKPLHPFGNIYWHELGFGAADDSTTGISFSITADAYHQGQLIGVLLVEPAILVFAFLLWSNFLGGTRHPANLILALILAHSASEAGTNAAIGQITYLAQVISIAWLCCHVFPLIGPRPLKRGFHKSFFNVGRRRRALTQPAPQQ